MSRALHLQGQAVATVLRFSNSSGDPDVHDGIANARALAVKFQLPDGKNADILALHIEGFPGRTPDEFLAFLRVLQSPPVNLLLSTYWTMGAVRHGDYIAKVRFAPVPTFAEKVVQRDLELLQTAAGRMIFARLREETEGQEVPVARS